MDHVQTSAVRRPSDTRVRRLSVNAAFLKDVKDDNRELKSLVERIYPMLEHPQIAVNHWPELVGLLGELRDQLALHFSLEEAFGYFEEAIETAPQLSLMAEQLRGEHTGLFERARELADQIHEVDSERTEKVAGFITHFQRFRHGFERHEEAELKLIFEAQNNDIGGGD